ncbi:MAG: hypothetical protein IKF72_05240 [Kiritimatiellae bacterium]|nr:hypothetical protein [Kiritimatiellia bacterium]
MNIKSIPVAVSLMALCASASDGSYPYTSGDTSLGDGTVVLTYEEGTTDVKTLTATPTDGGTITLTGDAMTFADDAAITLSTSGTVSFASKVTTLGKLTLSRSDGAYIVWTSNTALTEYAAQYQSWTNTFYNGGNIIVASDLEPNSVVYVSTGNICPGRIERLIDGPSSNIFTFNRITADHTYTFRPQISASGIRCITISRSPRFGYYPSTPLWANSKVQGPDKGHWCVANITDGGEKLGRVSEWGLTKIMAAKKGMAALANVRFDGGVTLGGETSVAAGMEAVVAVPEGDNTITETFTGDGDVRIVPMAPTTAYTGSYYFEPWITTSWQVIATNRSLSALTALTGRMLGGSHNYADYTDVGGTPTDAYHIKYDSATDTATCQFQYAAGSNNKVVMAMLRQNGLNVEIKATAAGFKPLSTHPINTDFSEIPLTGNVATSASTSGYGIHMITATFEGESKMGCVTLNGTMNAMVGNQLTFDGGERPLYVTVTSTTAFPTYGNVNVLTNADVKLCADGLTVGVGISGGTSTLKIKRGGILRRDDNGQIASSQQVEVDGGTLDHIGGGGIYLNYLLLKDGARMTSGSTAPRSVLTSINYYNVVGSEPSSIEGSGIRPYGNSTVSSARTFQINVNNVTGDEQVDCTLAGIQAPAAKFEYYHFEKYGDGALKLAGSGKPVRCQTRLYGGTFILGASNSMTNAVVLAGGNLAVADGKSNALDALTVNTNATLTVGEGGSLSFASFTAGEGLQPKAITIDAPLEGNVIKFNATLTDEERNLFRWKDSAAPTGARRVDQDEDGYLHPHTGGLLLFVK